ncbi:tachylectin-related carbohydrate-binding protein [Micromonospora sp. NPDC126480]|uniref:tachylectin-related carbohydrate-binding protein n=1 Tax=Micromonospora sp. NPDC126480 TaxID=3155312 RepID=UPI00332CC70F
MAFRHAISQFPGGSSRRRILSSAVALTVITTGVTVAVHTAPAQAATDSFTCTGPAVFFNSTTAGTLARRTYSTPGRDGGTFSAATNVGFSGWQSYGRLLGGPNGRVYGIKSNGLTRFRWTGSNWEQVDGKIDWLISSSFQSYAGASYRDKITVDEIGDFYLIDGNGKLRWYRFDESTRTWAISGRVLDTGWERFNLLVAAGPGVLYTRHTDGRLFRHHYDPVSQRWISRDRLVGSTSWSGFAKGLFSAGGDTLFGIQADGDLFQYRYREDNQTWDLVADQIGNGWGAFPNVFTTTDTCRQGANAGPPRPSTPVQADAPVAVMQAPAATTALGTLEFAYTDNNGGLRHGRAKPDELGFIQWSSAPGFEAYTGKPALVADAQDRVNLLAHEATTSDVRSLTQKTPAMPDWNPWLVLGGAMKSEPAVVRLSDNSLAVFAYDANGSLWSRRQDGSTGDLLPWTSLGGSGFAGNPVVVANADGVATILATTGTGEVRSATWRAGALTSGWVGLGGTGFTGAPATALLPGYRVMVFARNTDGTVKTQLRNIDGTWPGTWTAIGDGSITPDGSPSALLSPTTGRVWVFVRATDGSIHRSRQTAAGSTTWTTWGPVSSGETYPTDPTTFTWQNSGGQQIGFVTRTVNSAIRLYAADETADASAARSNRTATADPTFTRHDIPAPPRR